MSHGEKLLVWCGFSAKRTEKTAPLCSWHDSSVKFRENIELTIDYNFSVLGIMRSSVDIIGESRRQNRRISDRPLMAYPDSAYFKPPNWQFEEIIPPQELIRHAESWIKQRVSVVGGCCGLGPEQTKELSKLKR